MSDAEQKFSDEFMRDLRMLSEKHFGNETYGKYLEFNHELQRVIKKHVLQPTHPVEMEQAAQDNYICCICHSSESQEHCEGCRNLCMPEVSKPVDGELREELREGSEHRHFADRMTPDGKERVEMIPLEWALEVFAAHLQAVVQEARIDEVKAMPECAYKGARMFQLTQSTPKRGGEK